MHEDYWKSCLNLIKKELEVQSYNTWFKPIKPISYSNKILTLKQKQFVVILLKVIL